MGSLGGDQAPLRRQAEDPGARRGGGVSAAAPSPMGREAFRLWVATQARGRFERVAPEDAAAELEHGARLVDIRPGWQRLDEGTIPGAFRAP